MQLYCESLTRYQRLKTREVKVGNLLLGNDHPIRLQTMTTTDTMNTGATVEQSIRCIEAGAELVRITAPSKKEAENLLNIKHELNSRGYFTPLVADIHFTPNAAEIAARIVEKVRVNPGNYVDKKRFEQIEYTDAEYLEEIERIRERFTPLVTICKEYGTAMRIGTNHGSLSDRIMSRYGDTAIGMVESAMEFLRIARAESYHNIVLSMKSSNPQVMVQAYRLLIHQMDHEFSECYPLHLGVTEAGDGEDGRVKSAAGIGTLLEDGIGDTIRVSLTEDPELEIPVCRDLVKRYKQSGSPEAGKTGSWKTGRPEDRKTGSPEVIQTGQLSNELSKIITPGLISDSGLPGLPASGLSSSSGLPDLPASGLSSSSGLPDLPASGLSYNPFEYKRRETFEVTNIGAKHVPVVIADLSKMKNITPQLLQAIGYTYNELTDKWNISDGAADYIFTGTAELNFSLPGTLKVITWPNHWQAATDQHKYFPIYDAAGYAQATIKSPVLNFVMLDCFSDATPVNDFTGLDELANDPAVVLCLSSKNKFAMMAVRRMCIQLLNRNIKNPIVLICDSYWQTPDEHLIHFATETGALLLDGFGDGICLGMTKEAYVGASLAPAQIIAYPGDKNVEESTLINHRFDDTIVIQNLPAPIITQSSANTNGRNYTINQSAEQFLNTTAFSILQATRTRISKTEYISCPSCGRTLFDLQETTAKIRSRTSHLKGLKIAIMGCIVNGPGEMADADFGYVGSGPGKITLYKGKEVIKRNVPDDVAVEELIGLLKENDAWIEPVN